jgi:S-ribosylhomocysteine lyase LuxS involved in autoinducer biosynthesis
MVISFIVDHFMMQSIAKLYSIMDDKMNDELKRFGMKQSWPNQGKILEYPWRG